MIGGKTNSQITPTALGSLLQASVYGQTVPTIYGMQKSPLLAIWAQNIRQGPPPGTKKLKAKKKGTMVYIENIDFLVGHNPIMGLMQFWMNTTKLPLNFTSTTSAVSSYGPQTVTISDPYFYAVVGVTVQNTYNLGVIDYGSTDSEMDTGYFNTPLWNTAFSGPDPTNDSAQRFWPFVYNWTPAAGNVVSFPAACGGPITSPLLAPYNVTIYYAQLSTVLKRVSPLSHLRLTFEPTLADGPEYSGYSGQQVLMPPFAGAGSPNYDLGASGAIPDVRPEVQGSFGVYSTGDADFADMIEDIMKSGLAQVSPADATTTMNSQAVQHGASAFTFPGAVQKKISSGLVSNLGASATALAFDRVNVAGNFLLVEWCGIGATGTPGVSDSAGNSWTVIDAGSNSGGAWCIAYASAIAAAAGNTVTFTPSSSGTTVTMGITEISGVDTFDTSAAQTLATQFTNTLSLTTTNPQGQPGMVVAFSLNLTAPATNLDPTWNSFYATLLSDGSYAQVKTVISPTTVTLNNNVNGQVSTAVTRLVLVAFKLVAPPTYPAPFGNFMDDSSMQICRNQARAYGLWGSLTMTTQKSVRDWLANLYASMNSAPFYSGNLLKQAPYGEVSTAANGAVYVAPTSGGPIFFLSEDNGDFLGDAENLPVTVERTAQFDAPNILQYQIPNRASDYNPVVVSQPEAGSLALYGVRKTAPEMRDEITDTDVARILLGIAARRQAYIRNITKFKTKVTYILLEPMDLILVSWHES